MTLIPPTEAPAHRCQLPKIIKMKPCNRAHEHMFCLSRVTKWLPDGTRFICNECDQVWIVETRETGYVNVIPYPEWYLESRKQRRQRLGLRWWQREAR